MLPNAIRMVRSFRAVNYLSIFFHINHVFLSTYHHVADYTDLIPEFE